MTEDVKSLEPYQADELIVLFSDLERAGNPLPEGKRAAVSFGSLRFLRRFSERLLNNSDYWKFSHSSEAREKIKMILDQAR